MVEFTVAIKGAPENAVEWYCTWNSSATGIHIVYPPAGQRPWMQLDEKRTIVIPEGEDSGYLYVITRDVSGIHIPPPPESGHPDAWRVGKDIKRGSYTFRWNNGELSRVSLISLGALPPWKWIILGAVGLSALAIIVLKRKK